MDAARTGQGTGSAPTLTRSQTAIDPASHLPQTNRSIASPRTFRSDFNGSSHFRISPSNVRVKSVSAMKSEADCLAEQEGSRMLQVGSTHTRRFRSSLDPSSSAKFLPLGFLRGISAEEAAEANPVRGRSIHYDIVATRAKFILLLSLRDGRTHSWHCQ